MVSLSLQAENQKKSLNYTDMKKIIFVIAAMLLAALTARADGPKLSLKARVVDGLTMEPVKKARVVLLDAATGDTISKARPKAYYKSQGGSGRISWRI